MYNKSYYVIANHKVEQHHYDEIREYFDLDKNIEIKISNGIYYYQIYEAVGLKYNDKNDGLQKPGFTGLRDKYNDCIIYVYSPYTNIRFGGADTGVWIGIDYEYDKNKGVNNC
jgi:hypothetical protein